MKRLDEDKKNILNRFKTKEVQDYTYAILFLLVSSFFAFFVIRPVLSIAIGLRKEGQDLQRINMIYEQNITKVLQLQAELELIRPKRYLLEEALPENPQLNKLIEDIHKVAQSENIILDSVAIEGLQIKDAAKKSPVKDSHQVYGIKIAMGIQGSYEDVNRFLRSFSQQRRIKTIESVEVTREKDLKASSSATPAFVNIKLSVQAYYL